jgi:UDP-3-O-[3-hydroxymyristoyl] glucosamine N-acyltransferase
MIGLLEMFFVPEPVPALGVHPSAVVDPTATLGAQVRIGPHVSIAAGASIGDGVVLHAGVRIYEYVAIGAGTVVHANTVIRHRCRIGKSVILHQNVSIGADGFGYRPDPKSATLLKVPHLGNVVLEDGVEIGANTGVDRGKFGSTIIGAGTKVDNLVQIGHNVRIGRCCVIAGCVGISGSVQIGDGVQVGGAAGFIDHVQVGDRAKIGAMTLVTKDMPPGATWLGLPADEAQATLRQWASVRKLPELIRRLTKSLESGEQVMRRAR